MYRQLTGNELQRLIQCDPNNAELRQELVDRILNGSVRLGGGRNTP